jgi:hypothetical protein
LPAINSNSTSVIPANTGSTKVVLPSAGIPASPTH